jgi:glutathione S-transferase
MPDSADRLEIFWISGSPYAWRVLLTLEVKGLPYESRLLEESKGENRTPPFLALNPRGKIPTLRHGKIVLPESLAIMAYLDRFAPEPPLFGMSAAETGRIWRAISDCVYYLEAPVEAAVHPILECAKNADDTWRGRVQEVHAELKRLERSLEPAHWLATAAVSAADLATYPFVRFLLRGAERAAKQPLSAPFDLGLQPFARLYPNLAAWMARIEALPGYERTFPPHWRLPIPATV